MNRSRSGRDRGNTQRERSEEDALGWYGSDERRYDLGDRRGSGTIGGSDIGIFRPDWQAVAPDRWARRRRYYSPYYYDYYGYPVPPSPYYYPSVVVRPRYSWWNYFW